MRFIAGLVLLALACLSGCVRHPVNQDCQWSDPRSGPLDLDRSADRNHLREDVETAEDLAVRFMDSHGERAAGPPGHVALVFNQCFAKLAAAISAEHRVTPAQFMSVYGHRPPGVDAAVGISFALLYAWAVSVWTLRLWRRYGTGGVGGAVMIGYVSLIAAGIGVLLGDAWAGAWEMLRIGNGHLSFRLDRVPWGHHYFALFLALTALLWIVAALRLRGSFENLAPVRLTAGAANQSRRVQP